MFCHPVLSGGGARRLMLASAAILRFGSRAAQTSAPPSLPPVTVDPPQQKRAVAPARRNAAPRGRRACSPRRNSRRRASRERPGEGARADGSDRPAGATRHSANAWRRRHRSRRGLPELDRRQHHQGYPRLRPRRIRAAQMGRRHAAVDPRLRPVTQFPSARRPALHGRHSDQHADGYGDFQEIDPTAYKYVAVYKGANGLQFGANALGGAINFVTATGRDPFPERRFGRSRRLRIPPPAGQCRRHQRSVGRFCHRVHAGGRGIPGSQLWAGDAGQRQCRLPVLA